MAQADDPEKTEAPYSFRRRLSTSKGEDFYLKNYEKYSFHFYESWKNVDDILTWKAKQSSCDDDLLLYDDYNINFKSTTTSQKLSSKHSSDKLSSKSGSGLSSRS